MDKLFSPFTVKHINLKNRIVMPPLASFLIGDDGSITDETSNIIDGVPPVDRLWS